MKNNKETAIIFKKKSDSEGNVEFVPVKIIKGIYNEHEKAFIDNEGTYYYHILENPNNFGFGYRNYIDAYRNKYPLLNKEILMKFVFHTIKKYKFSYKIENETKAPLVMLNDKNTKPIILLDEDTKKIYSEKYPLFVKKYLGQHMEEEKTPDIDINSLYNGLTSKIIDQDEQVKEILTVLWKQCSNIPDNKSRSILIKGNTGVGKTEIFRYLLPKLNVPYFMTTANFTSSQYNGKCIEGMLFELLKSAGLDEEKASRGILVIDKIEKIEEVSYQLNIINDLLKILDGDTFKLYLNVGEYKIDTRNLMIICLFNPKEYKKGKKNTIGYGVDNSDLGKKEEEIIAKFSKVIEMNELTKESYIKILKSKNGTLNQNRELLKNNGVKLRIIEGTMNEISNRTMNSKYGVRSLDEIVEKTLSLASFEIANNPELYSELIITPETIKDNKKYTLVRRKEEQK